MALHGSRVARALGIVAYGVPAIVVVACSTQPFAPADPVDAGDDATAASGIDAAGLDATENADANRGDGSVDPLDAATDADGADAAPACLFPKRPTGDACMAASDCCSNACAFDHACKDTCTNVAAACSIGSDCCVGTYCSANALAHCTACHADGTIPEVDNFGGSNIAVVDSCCSRHVDSQGKCNP